MKKMFLLLVSALLIVDSAGAAESKRNYWPWVYFATFAGVSYATNAKLKKAHDGASRTLQIAKPAVQKLVYKRLHNIGLQNPEAITLLEGDPDQKINTFFATNDQIVIPRREHGVLADFATAVCSNDLRDEAEELLAVLEHEGAHIKHGDNRIQQHARRLIPLATIAASGVMFYATGYYKRIEPRYAQQEVLFLSEACLAGHLNAILNRGLFSALSRYHEQRADDAVTDPRAFSRWFKKLPQQQVRGYWGRLILDTHPTHEHRIAVLDARAERMEAAAAAKFAQEAKENN